MSNKQFVTIVFMTEILLYVRVLQTDHGTRWFVSLFTKSIYLGYNCTLDLQFLKKNANPGSLGLGQPRPQGPP